LGHVTKAKDRRDIGRRLSCNALQLPPCLVIIVVVAAAVVLVIIHVCAGYSGWTKIIPQGNIINCHQKQLVILNVSLKEHLVLYSMIYSVLSYCTLRHVLVVVRSA